MSQSDDKISAALNSVFASAFLSVAKLVVGLMTGSLGILSEAAHSLLDLSAAGLTYFAVRVSDQPADSGHPYGHGKIESVSALIETGLLFITALLILREAVLRLIHGGEAVAVTWYAIAVIVLSIVVDFTRSRALMKVAKETRSQALEADALHFSSDILSSAVVLVGLGCAAAGYSKGDALAAIGVSFFVFGVGYDLGKRTINVLIDAAPDGIAERLGEVARAVDGVARVDLVRARPAGSTVFVEILVRVSRTMPLDRAEQVCAAVAAAVIAAVPEASPSVKALPVALDNESVIDTVRMTAARLGLMVHDIGVHSLGERSHVSFDIEVEETMSILDAHKVADGIELAIREELGEDIYVDTHIDPRRFNVVNGSAVAREQREDMTARIEHLARAVHDVQDIRKVWIQDGDDGLYVSLRCLFAPDTAIRTVHAATVTVETHIRHNLPGVSRVVVHAEPTTAASPP